MTDNRLPPTARIEPQGAIISYGTTTVLRCIVTGTPTPTIVWSRRSGPLRLNHIVCIGDTQTETQTDTLYQLS